MKVIVSTVRWLFGLFFCLVAIGGFISGDILAAMVTLFIGLLLIPSTYSAMFSRKNGSRNTQSPSSYYAGKPGKGYEEKATRSAGITEKEVQTYKEDDSIIDVTDEAFKISFSTVTKATTATQPSQPTSEKRTFRLQVQQTTEEALSSYSVSPNLEQQVDRISSLEATSSYSHYETDYWKLGKRFKQKLGLNTQEVSLLNKIVYYDNAFTSMEGCCIATAKLYLSVMKELKKQLQRKGSSMTKEIQVIQEMAVVVYKAQESYYWSSSDESYTRQRVASDVYSTVFKRCEYAMREAFLHKRKISTIYTGNNDKLAAEFEARIGGAVDAAIKNLVTLVGQPDEDTEIELNAQNVTRWKTQLEGLSSQLVSGSKDTFIEGVYILGRLNKKNPSIEHIFYEASKFISKHDKEAALRFYLHYLHHDLNSNTVDNKQLTKTIQKSLFKDTEQLKRFEEILNQFMEDEDLQKALADIPSVYTKQRKRIQLDLGTIREVQQQHSGTVELLNEYLQEEDSFVSPEDTPVAPPEAISPVEEEEIQLEINVLSTATSDSRWTPELVLDNVQQELLDLFHTNSLYLAQQQVETFSKVRGAFKNQLIDSINESCYELLDDVLIEEDGEHYSIYENYFQQLLKK